MTQSDKEVAITEKDYFLMGVAIEEARKGMGRTSPNPCVGAVIVKDGEEVSRGFHKKAGTPHAEIHALNAAGGAAQGATMYVTLEPCNHTGKTPPCSHAVAGAGISRVVIGMTDPNPLVSGSGIDYLEERGIEVVTGVLEEECQELNRPFLKHITTGLPFVIMKAGMSLDGRLSYQKSIPGKMTGPASLQKLHELRDQVDAILIGSGTQIADNPSLTTRLEQNGKDPLRVVLDSKLSIDTDAQILHLQSAAPTLIVCTSEAEKKKVDLLRAIGNVEVEIVAEDAQGYVAVKALLQLLGKRGVTSLLVEGGSAIHSSFLKSGEVDRVMLFIAPLFAGSYGNPLLTDLSVGKREEAIKLQNVQYLPCGDDLLVQGDLS